MKPIKTHPDLRRAMNHAISSMAGQRPAGKTPIESNPYIPASDCADVYFIQLWAKYWGFKLWEIKRSHGHSFEADMDGGRCLIFIDNNVDNQHIVWVKDMLSGEKLRYLIKP